MTYEEHLERPSCKLEATDPSLFVDLPKENNNEGPADRNTQSVRQAGDVVV